MIPNKAYILKISNPLSEEYAKTAAASCEKVGMPYEYFQGLEGISWGEAWRNSGIKIPDHLLSKRLGGRVDKAACCSASHAKIWKQIYDNKECAIILEHDGYMLHNIDIDIPDNAIVVLGYKLRDIQKYDSLKAGPPKEIRKIDGHEGAHAYAITWKTAEILLDELQNKGPRGEIDNIYFLKTRKTAVPIHIMVPTPAIGWLRKSTIWNETSIRNYDFIEEFRKYIRK
jgi:hypothetical protein